jgi:hypothetical protein
MPLLGVIPSATPALSIPAVASSHARIVPVHALKRQAARIRLFLKY